ncbi:AMP-binding protein [Acidovorax soli]|uniref:Fatty-acyl-CoA synthase n=1 Tax=Acidovorax soli TaxID=592050 RepID=A0A1H3XXJ3_9BURK|nr:AMP-binding protein [Acidovorax soli]SEA04189.1 fatty-acyl-CoA synthase [Acidovorax soli]
MSALHTGSTVAEAYQSALQSFPERVALVLPDGSHWTCAELLRRVHAMARYLRARGLQRQDGLAVLAGNQPEALVVIMACAWLGLRQTSLHPLSALDDQAFVLQDADISALVVGAQHVERGLALQERGIVPQVLGLGPSALGEDAIAASLAFDGGELPIAAQPEDIYRITYTGGTTGRPKGVVHRSRTTLTMLLLQLACWEWPEALRVLVATPISHAGGSLVLPTLLRGGTLVLLEKYSPDAFLQAVQQHRITATFLVPTQIYGLLDHPGLDQWDRSSLQYVLYGASPMAPARLAEALQRFGPIFGQLYGQAEAPMTIAYLRKDAHDLARPERLQSCGLALPGNQVRLLDAQGREVAAGEVGELCVRSPLVMEGYRNRPDATEEAFADGWLHTGDMARRDADGYLYLVDRAKDMVITGGFNVYSSEVEACLALHPAVAQSAVIGMPDAKWGEAVVALVVLKPGASAEPQALMDFVHERKGALHTPKQLWLEQALPVTPLGKIDKKALRARFWDGQARQVG